MGKQLHMWFSEKSISIWQMFGDLSKVGLEWLEEVRGVRSVPCTPWEVNDQQVSDTQPQQGLLSLQTHPIPTQASLTSPLQGGILGHEPRNYIPKVLAPAWLLYCPAACKPSLHQAIEVLNIQRKTLLGTNNKQTKKSHLSGKEAVFVDNVTINMYNYSHLKLNQEELNQWKLQSKGPTKICSPKKAMRILVKIVTINHFGPLWMNQRLATTWDMFIQEIQLNFDITAEFWYNSELYGILTCLTLVPLSLALW